ncbi:MULTISPECIES: hypothetical protein [Kitasatospora]|uniref:Uncharacterized protein n=2 Tax=Kitasatospora TaxID=2063 RepID=A0ABT1J4R2_9ACTN|nr:hypothetical protein [Kitasatospora paracochleata]MCP2312417.1 hypothetical protein [Kitasatospora paracochleata]
MTKIPLLCPRCGHAQRVEPGGPQKTLRVVHADTGEESCRPVETAVAAGREAQPPEPRL